MKARVRDYLFFLFWSGSTLLLGLLGLPCLLSRRATQWLARAWASHTLWLLKHICGIDSFVRGYRYILTTPAIYAAKHQSTWDTLMLYLQLHNPAFVLKRSLYAIPVFGWYLWRSGQIGIDRKAGKQALDQVLAQAERYVGEGRSIVIFPEGTRKAPFAEPEYKQGVARLSERTGLPVVPVALNAGKVWPRTPIAKRTGNAIIEFLPTMPPAGSARTPWLDDLAQRIESSTLALLHEA